MAQINHYGVIDADRVYSHKTLAEILGRKERWMRDFIRKWQVPCLDAGNGLLLVSGQSFLRAIESAAKGLDEDDLPA